MSNTKTQGRKHIQDAPAPIAFFQMEDALTPFCLERETSMD